MTEKETKILENTFEEKFRDMYSEGMIDGAKAICSVILEKVNNNEMSIDERLNEIQRFCKVSLGEK